MLQRRGDPVAAAGSRFGDENHGKIMDVGYAGCGETMQNLCLRMSPVDLGMSDNGVSLVYGNSIGKNGDSSVDFDAPRLHFDEST